MPPTSLASSGEKLGMDPRISQPAYYGLCREPFFSREQWDLSKFVGVSRKVATYGDHCRKRTLGVHGLAWEAYVSYWSGFPLQGVHRFESPRLSDMSNRLFVVVIT
jgi:hypothetical protein